MPESKLTRLLWLLLLVAVVSGSVAVSNGLLMPIGAAFLFIPWLIGTLVLTWLVCGVFVTRSALRARRGHDHGGDADPLSWRVDLAWRLAELNMALIAVNTALGVLAYALNRSTDLNIAHVRVGYLPVAVADVILFVIIGAYVAAVALACFPQPSAYSWVRLQKLRMWAWASMPVALLLWLGCMLLFGGTIDPTGRGL